MSIRVGTDPNTSLTCDRFISLDNCHIPYLIIGPALFVLISLIVIWGVRKRIRFLRKKEFRKMQLAERSLLCLVCSSHCFSRREVAELARAWVIKPEDLELQDRLDLFSTGTQGEVYRARWGSMNVWLNSHCFLTCISGCCQKA